MLDAIEVFKAGRHVALNGKAYDFTEADVAGMASSYDPAVLAAPIVIGHPKTDDPAWGWAKGLTVSDAGVLVAQPEKVDAAFAEGVEAGRYRYVSASFYEPTDARNPKPGSWYLKHIGFLGAVPPAVKGLQPAFSEAPEPELVSFAAAEAWPVVDLFRGLRDWVIEEKGIEVADRILPTWYIDAIKPPEAMAAPGFAEGDDTLAQQAGAESLAGASGNDSLAVEPPVDTLTGGAGNDVLDARVAELDAREAAVNAREAEFAERARQDARSEDAAFLDGLVSGGRLPPAQRDRVAALFARLDGDQGVSFAEPDADPRAELRALLGGLGQTISFSEFAAGDGFDGAPDPAALAVRAQQLVSDAASRGETLSYADAVVRAGRA